tara:strand:+ start:852 stop:1172 length:321 start_codon:yes stop_codon:yes gene_type:complete
MKVRTVTGANAIVSSQVASVALGDTTSATIMTANPYRKSFTVTNTGTNKIYIKLGTGATSSSWHYVLPGGGANDDGNGGSVSVDGYTAEVAVCAASTGRYHHVEFG